MKPIAVCQACQAKRLLDHISAKTVVYLSCALIKTKDLADLKTSWLSLCGSQFVCLFVCLFFCQVIFSLFFLLLFFKFRNGSHKKTKTKVVYSQIFQFCHCLA